VHHVIDRLALLGVRSAGKRGLVAMTGRGFDRVLSAVLVVPAAVMLAVRGLRHVAHQWFSRLPSRRSRAH
jgi:hypothetical protein